MRNLTRFQHVSTPHTPPTSWVQKKNMYLLKTSNSLMFGHSRDAWKHWGPPTPLKAGTEGSSRERIQPNEPHGFPRIQVDAAIRRYLPKFSKIQITGSYCWWPLHSFNITKKWLAASHWKMMVVIIWNDPFFGRLVVQKFFQQTFTQKWRK